MTIFYQEKPSSILSKKCKPLLALVIKYAFAKCHSLRSKHTDSSIDSEEVISIFDDEEEEIFISSIISKYMELKSKRKLSTDMDIFNRCPPPRADGFTTTQKPVEKYGANSGETGDEFRSANSRLLSRCSIDTSSDAFLSANTCLSRCSSSNMIGNYKSQDSFDDNQRSSIILKQLVHCEGWPFGLCRKALFLLPPLPKCPVDSWSWRKSG